MRPGTPVIQLQRLSKNFAAFLAVNDLSLTVYPGDVFGFLGPNGAGKSTTIRMMLSLIAPTKGEVFLFGKNLQLHRNEVLRKVGCIVERPDFYTYLSAEKNLELFGRLFGMAPPRKRIYELMELVGLKGRERDLVKNYSHGMKQRLGLAQTLVHDPQLIILDEPTTGLDPQGIIDIRQLILRLKSEFGKTIFLSSHLLSEVEQIATRMAIISRGKTMVEGDAAALLSSHDLLVKVEVDDAEKTKRHLAESDWQAKLKKSSGTQFHFSIAKNEIPALSQFLQGKEIAVFSITYRRSLEEYYLNLTGETVSLPDQKQPDHVGAY
jgi:ABC-type multidrug transport system ATPase subunit